MAILREEKYVCVEAPPTRISLRNRCNTKLHQPIKSKDKMARKHKDTAATMPVHGHDGAHISRYSYSSIIQIGDLCVSVLFGLVSSLADDVLLELSS